MAGPMTPGTTSRRPITGRQLVLALTAIVFATAVLPPAAAWTLNARRITATEDRATLVAEQVRAHVDGAGAGPGVVCGPGDMPQARSATVVHDSWMLDARKEPQILGAGTSTDAWGRCFLLNLGAERAGGHVWVLSAGPNGVVETARDGRALAGDDIGAVVK